MRFWVLIVMLIYGQLIYAAQPLKEQKTEDLERRRAEIETQLKATVATAEYNRLNNELADLQNKIEELTDFDRILKNVADQKIELDLDDGVKANYPKLSLAASGVKKNAQILEAIK